MALSILARRTLLATAVLAAAVPSLAWAQAQAKPPAPPPQQAPAQPPSAQAQPAPPTGQGPPAKPGEVYTYNPEGRRDPFVSLLFRGTDLRSTRESRPEGLGGLMINEVTIRGIIRSRSGFVAMLQAPDNKTYIVHQNDRLMDGSVKAITADAVIFSQDVNDPLSLVKQREVRKYLRVSQEGK